MECRNLVENMHLVNYGSAVVFLQEIGMIKLRSPGYISEVIYLNTSQEPCMLHSMHLVTYWSHWEEGLGPPHQAL